MGLIDGDVLIAWIKGSQQMTSKVKAIIAKIKTMPTVDAVSVEWISCDERLPSENGYYLCCNKKYLPYVGHFIDGHWIDFDCTIMHADAWMPLPEPWKGADDE